jgi:hypothetical protein
MAAVRASPRGIDVPKPTIHERMAESARQTRREDRAMAFGAALYVALGVAGVLFYSPDSLFFCLGYGFIGLLEGLFLWRSRRRRTRRAT